MTAKLNATSLRQARHARKLSLEDVASYAKISESRLRFFEAGDLEPSFKQLARLSDLYNAPLYAFYGDKPLKFDETLPDFRKTNPSAANLSPKGLSRLWQIEHRSKFIDELRKALGEKAPVRTPLHRLTNRSIPDATGLRATFDGWLESRDRTLRFSGAPEDVFFRQLRLFLETRACSTTLNSAPTRDYLGFYDKFSEHSRIIFVNTEIKHQRRRLFTLCHEMAHFVYDEEGLSDPFVSAKNDIERKCNYFAAEFIAPEYLIYRIIDRAGFSPTSDPDRLIDLVSKETMLSRQASALRLGELSVITKKAASAFFAKISAAKRVVEYEPQSKPGGPMGKLAAIGKKLSEVGVYASYVASIAMKNKIVDIVDVERGLGISESIQREVLDLASRRYEASAD